MAGEYGFYLQLVCPYQYKGINFRTTPKYIELKTMAPCSIRVMFIFCTVNYFSSVETTLEICQFSRQLIDCPFLMFAT